MMSRLDGRVSASFVAQPWRHRAALSGYAKALQIHGVEIDEIDVLSWDCGLLLPARPRRSSHSDEFGAFVPWQASLSSGDNGQWRDELPFTPVEDASKPRLVRALDLVWQYGVRTGSIRAWLALPDFLYRLGLTETPLPCLVVGAKALRNRRQPSLDTARALLRSLASSARRGLETLDVMEGAHRLYLKVIKEERKPSSLPRLLALTLTTPMLSPKLAGEKLGLSISGAGKLLDRAASLGLLTEVSGRSAWKRYLVPDLAVSFGFASAPRGRPRKIIPTPPYDRDLAATLDAFDNEMRLLDLKLSTLGIAPRPSSTADPPMP